MESGERKMEIKEKVKKVYMDTFGEVVLSFETAMSSVIERIKDTIKQLQEAKEDFHRLRTDAISLLYASYSNMQKLVTVAYHSYNFEDCVNTRERNWEKIEPNFSVVTAVRRKRERLALAINDIMEKFRLEALVPMYHKIDDRSSLCEALRFLIDHLTEVCEMALNVVDEIGDQLLLVPFQVESEKRRLVLFLRRLRSEFGHKLSARMKRRRELEDVGGNEKTKNCCASA